MIDTNLPIKSAALLITPRPDVVSALGEPRLANAGFTAKLRLEDGKPLPEKTKVCVLTHDPEFGSHLLAIPSEPWLCPADGQ